MEFGVKPFDSLDAISVTDSLDSLIFPTEGDDLSRLGSSYSLSRLNLPKTTKLQVRDSMCFDLLNVG